MQRLTVSTEVNHNNTHHILPCLLFISPLNCDMDQCLIAEDFCESLRAYLHVVSCPICVVLIRIFDEANVFCQTAVAAAAATTVYRIIRK